MRKSLYRRHNEVFLGLLRRYREQGKFRQRDLAQHLGSGQGTVSKAETGNRRLDVIELREWLMAMGVDFLEFMTELHEQLEALSHQLDPRFLHRSLEKLARPEQQVSEMSAVSPPVGGVQEQFDVETAALARILAPAMRSALFREVANAISDVRRDDSQSRLLFRWFSSLPSGAKDAVVVLQPTEQEIGSRSHDLARLLFSNWVGLLGRYRTIEATKVWDAVRSGHQELPPELLAGSVAWPIPETEVKRLLLTYLRSCKVPELLNQCLLVQVEHR